jgi:hypothetical protein
MRPPKIALNNNKNIISKNQRYFWYDIFVIIQSDFGGSYVDQPSAFFYFPILGGGLPAPLSPVLEYLRLIARIRGDDRRPIITSIQQSDEGILPLQWRAPSFEVPVLFPSWKQHR